MGRAKGRGGDRIGARDRPGPRPATADGQPSSVRSRMGPCRADSPDQHARLNCGDRQEIQKTVSRQGASSRDKSRARDKSMDLSFTPEQEQFRAKVRKFLIDNLPAGWGKAGFRPEGMSMIEFMRDWQRRLYEGGFLGMAWPREFGGQGASQIEMAIFNEEVARVRAPAPLNVLGLTMAAPTIITYGTDEQKS